MRRILVTGANKGIGLAITTAILEREADTCVFLGSRSLERGEAARSSIVEQHPEWASRLEVLKIDVASDPSVEQAVRALKSRCADESSPLYGIVNNAGINVETGDASALLNVNVMGIHRVCAAFLPLLEPSIGRIVNVTSASGPMFVSGCSEEHRDFLCHRDTDWSTLQTFMQAAVSGQVENFDAEESAYGFSKACANSYTVWLARENPNILINACTPGWIETDMTRYHVDPAGKSAADLGMKSPSEGARSAMFLMFAELEGSGGYYGSDAVRSPLDQYRAPGSPPFVAAVPK